jgi:hypothetical protein
MKILNKIERKIGKYAIPNLPLLMILLEAVGYTLYVVAPKVLNYICFEPAAICSGQVWRLFTWVLMPPSRLDIFAVITLFFYYWIARTLAATWGDFYFNVYVLGGIVVTDIGMMLAYPVLLSMNSGTSAVNLMLMPAYVNMYFIQTTILLAFAFTYPNAQVLLYFIIPIKMSWLGIFEGVMLVYRFITVKFLTPRLVILMALLNVLLYFLMTKDLRRFHPKEFVRRAKYRRATGQRKSFFDNFSGKNGSGNQKHGASGTGAGNGSWQPGGAGQEGGADSSWRSGASASRRAAGYTRIYPNGARHKCAICGRTEQDDDSLEFRFCSKCEGNYEYCQDHLFTHQHIKNGTPGD